MQRINLFTIVQATCLILITSTISHAVERPNILFCIADDASWPHMGAYGCHWVKTPGFDRVAREGILFRNAYTPNAKCAPSRACLLTGRNTWQLEEACNHMPYFPAKFVTYVEALQEHDYWVGHTAKGWAPGDPGKVKGKRRQLCGPAWNKQKTKPPAQHMSNNDYSANFRDFLDVKPKNQPFCFWYGAIEPHRRYEYGAGIKKGGKRLSDVDRVFPFWPDNETVRTDLLDYAFEIEYFDHHIVRMLDLLESRGLLANTLVVVTADNGMPFPRIKGQMYDYSNHLPLAIMWKRGIRNPGRVVDDYVNFIDLAPTYLDLAGISIERTAMQPIQGRSLMTIFKSMQGGQVIPHRDHTLFGKERHDVGRPFDWGYPIRGIIKNGYLYLRNFEPQRWPCGNPETGYLNCDGGATKTVCLQARRAPETYRYWSLSLGKRPPEELYDLNQDRACVNNLADSVIYASIKDDLRSQMERELIEQGDPRMLGRGAVFEKYPAASKEANFYERFKRGEKLNAGWVNPSDFEDDVK